MAPQIETQIIELKKRYPLRISRGISAGSKNVFVFAKRGGHIGIGEAAPGTGHNDDTFAEECQESILSFAQRLDRDASLDEIWRAGRTELEMPALAAIDVALWDLLAKEAGMPLHRLLGLPSTMVATSVTVGINPVEVIRERVPELLRRTNARALKVKLGSPDGIERDKENFSTAQEAAQPFGAVLRVDANGGWSLDGAGEMMKWLAERNCDYVEQPLPKGDEERLPILFRNRPLPIFVDESCHFSADIPALADRVDGVNVKLMKCGGISEALRLVATARAHGLKTMIGCMGESSIAISGGASIGALFDYIDLDSHLNLNPDPAKGLKMKSGILQLSETPGHGAELC